MHFSNIVLGSAFAAATFAMPTPSAMTSQGVVDAITGLTTLSQKLQGPANTISIVNGPLILIGQGPFPQIIAGFSGIITQVTDDINAMDPSQPPFTVAADETAIVDALTTFVQVHQQLLNILIGKAGLFQSVPFIGDPVASVLRQLEGVVDSIAFDIIRLIPDQSDPANAQTQSLDATLSKAIDAYSGVV